MTSNSGHFLFLTLIKKTETGELETTKQLPPSLEKQSTNGCQEGDPLRTIFASMTSVSIIIRLGNFRVTFVKEAIWKRC